MDEASLLSNNGKNEIGNVIPRQSFASPSNQLQVAQPAKRKRNHPGNPDPEAEVVALSPNSLQATNRFVCDVCNKGFQRDQNLQLHRRGHNLPWKLKQRTDKEVKKKVYICPEPTCVHHEPSRALGDLTGIKKHYSRKHGEKKWKCEKCSKRYAVKTDWKAHFKICGTKEYRCDCGTLFSRRDSFITHRAFCDALAEESSRAIITTTTTTQLHNNHGGLGLQQFHHLKTEQDNQLLLQWLPPPSFPSSENPNVNPNPNPNNHNTFSSFPHMSATALLQKASQMGVSINKNGCDQSSESIVFRPHQANHMSTGNNGSCLDLSSSSSREEITNGLMMIRNLSSFDNKPGATMAASTAGVYHDNTIDSLQSGTRFQESAAFEESFNGFLNSKNDGNYNELLTESAGSHLSGGGQEGLTRDFLGIRAAFSQRDLMNMAGLDQIGSSSSSTSHNHQQNNQNAPPWQ